MSSGAAYVSSKFGLRGLTQQINVEERGHGVRACSICPRDINTPLLDKRPQPPSPEVRARDAPARGSGRVRLAGRDAAAAGRPRRDFPVHAVGLGSRGGCHTATAPPVLLPETSDVNQTPTAPAPFEASRGRLFGLAYRMLGSRADAEDIVQEAYVRWHQADRRRIENPEAWLVTTTTRLAIDRLRRLKTEREAYVGPWLPEPIVGDGAAGPPPRVAEDLSMAFLTLLERLAPEERAAFLLHDVFDVGYRRDRGGASSEARRRAARSCTAPASGSAASASASTPARPRRRSLLQQFTGGDRGTRRTGAACRSSRPMPPGRPMAAARQLRLCTRSSAPTGSRGSSSVCGRSSGPTNRTIEVATVNGEPGLCIRDGDRLTATMSIATDGERILPSMPSSIRTSSSESRGRWRPPSRRWLRSRSLFALFFQLNHHLSRETADGSPRRRGGGRRT